MIHAIELFLDSYMADAYPISWFTPVMLACISFIHPRRPAQWATLFVVLAVTIGLCIATSALGLVKYGWIMFCGMLAIWYSAAPIYMIFDGSFNKEWLYIGKPSFVFWLSYSSIFFGGIAFVMATTLSFVDYGFLPTFVCLLIGGFFFGIVYLMTKMPGGLQSRYSAAYQPQYRVPCKDISNMTPFELVNSFDFRSERSDVAVRTLQSASLKQIDQLLEIESHIFDQLCTYKVVSIAGCALAAVACICASTVTPYAPYYAHFLENFCGFALGFVAFVMWWRKSILWTRGHADSILALSFVNDRRCIPALVRGLGFIGPQYAAHSKSFAEALTDMCSKLKPGESCKLDMQTCWCLATFLTRTYRAGKSLPGAQNQLALSLIQTHAFLANPVITKCIRKLARKRSDLPQRLALSSAAFDILRPESKEAGVS